jgi:hypothetical protein
MKYAKRRDANERPIIDALKRAGCAVSQLGDMGVPDLLVSKGGVVWLIEVKLPLGPKGGVVGHSELNASQEKWWKEWIAAGGKQPVVVRSAEEAMEVVK